MGLVKRGMPYVEPELSAQEKADPVSECQKGTSMAIPFILTDLSVGIGQNDLLDYAVSPSNADEGAERNHQSMEPIDEFLLKSSTSILCVIVKPQPPWERDCQGSETN